MRLRSLSAAAATGASLLLVPFATPADAVTTTSTTVAYVADTDGNGRGELWTRPADGSGTPVKVFSTTNKVWLPALSPDGTRVAYLEDRSGSTGAYTNFRLFVRNTDGTGTAKLLYSGADVIGAAAWSRDGERLVFSAFAWDTDVSATYTIPSAGGPLTPVPTALIGGEPSFSPSGDQVAVDVMDADWNFVGIDLVTLSTGTRARIAGTDGGSDPVWSPDGQHILFQKELECGVALYRVPAGGGTPVTMREVPGYFLGSHEYSRDGSQIFYGMSRWQPCNPGPRSGNVWVMNADASGAERVTNTVDVHEYSTSVAGGTPAVDTTPPPAPAGTRATVSYSNITLSWPSGGDTTHFVVLWKPPGSPAPTSVTDGTLVYAGPAHWARLSTGADSLDADLYVFAYDSSGNLSPVSAAHRARTTPTPVMRTIPRVGGSTTDTTAQVRWGGPEDPGYELQVGRRTRLADGTWSAPVYGTTRTTTVGALDFRGTQGQTYYFRARATDGYGNFTRWAATPSVAYIPYDDAAPVVSYSGAWTARTSSTRYLGTYRTATQKGASLTLRVQGGKLVVRGDRCPSCGAFAVYEDGVYRKTIDTRTTTATHVRQVLYTGGGTTIRPRTLRLVVVGTPTRPRVSVDSLTATR